MVGLQPGVATAEVADHLVRRLGQHLRVVALDTVDADGLDRAERDHDRVVLVAVNGDDAAATRWRDFCLRAADVVVLVGSTAADPHAGRAGAGLPPRAGAHRTGPDTGTTCRLGGWPSTPGS